METFKNVKIYDWVVFFRSLCKAIDTIGQDTINRNENLKEKAKLVFGDTHPIYINKEIDPFSFIYTLAQKNTVNQKNTVFQACIDAFKLDINLPTDWYFPTPTSVTKTLFYSKGNYIDDFGNLVPVDILWKLFSDVYNEETIDENDFKSILSIKNVGVVKLTQTIFLINPEKFLPIDERTITILPNESNPVKEIKILGLSKYQELLNLFNSIFPECYAYEINLFLNEFTGASKKSLKNKFCQISTMVDGQNKKDYYDDFVKNSSVRSGSSGDHKKRGREYPLDKVSYGDIVFIRRGTVNMGGIGVIIDNEYLDGGYSDNKSIKIVWINKSQRRLPSAMGDWNGFNLATPNTISKFKTTYADTFELIDLITTNSKNNDNINGKNNNDMKKYSLNQILYGPPGTGKTHKLQKEYFKEFTISESSLTREQFLENLVADLNWWQVISIALYDLEKAKVTEIHNHEIVKAKEKISDSITVRPTIWGQLQRHTKIECQYVNVKDRSEPLYFYKDKDSFWTIDKELLSQYFPEAIDILDSLNDFIGSDSKLIKNYEFITFHQSFSYEDFIEGIKPKLEEGESDLSFEIKDGVFKKLCLKAEADPENDYALFIDEINRGNVSAIFGELITLIEEDKRLGGKYPLKVKLPYSKKEFGVPSNLYIIGTMNTADRSVEALDTALRRRFSFVEMMPDEKVFDELTFTDSFARKEIMLKINQRIEALLDRNYTLGHSYFIKDDFKNSFENEIIPLLQEYFYNDYGKIGLVLGKGFVQEKMINESKITTSIFADFDTKNDIDIVKTYELIPFTDVDFDLALQTLLA